MIMQRGFRKLESPSIFSPVHAILLSLMNKSHPKRTIDTHFPISPLILTSGLHIVKTGGSATEIREVRKAPCYKFISERTHVDRSTRRGSKQRNSRDFCVNFSPAKIRVGKKSRRGRKR